MTPQYVVTKAPGFVLDGPFGKLWKLSENKWAQDKHLIYYDQIAEGKLEDLAKLAQEMNVANEPKAETVIVEVKNTGDPVAVAEDPRLGGVGIPTAPSRFDPQRILREVKRDVELADAGKINLVEFIGRVRRWIGAE